MPIFTRLVNFCWSLFQWSLLITVAVALLVGGYLYLRLDDEIRRQVEKRLSDHYTNLHVEVARARFEKDHGIAIYDIALFERQSTGPVRPIISIDELYLAGNMRLDELVADRLCIDEIVVRRPRLQAVRQDAGHWNVTALLPLPQLSENLPVIKVEDAILVVEDATQSPTVARTLQGINLTLTPVVTGQAVAQTGKPFRIAGTATGLPAREVRVEGEVNTSNGSYTLTVTITALEVSPELVASLPGVRTAELRGAEVSGRVDATLRVSGAAADEPPTWSATVTADRARIAHPSLPEPLSELSFTATVDADRLHIERLDCRCGAANIVLAGDRAGWASNAPLAIAAKVTSLPLNDSFVAILPESCGRIWQRFQPTGVVDAEIRLSFDGRQWRPQLVAECRGVSLTDAKKFPYRLEQTTGRLEYHAAQGNSPDKLRLDLTGIGGGRPVRIESELTHLDPPSPLGWVEITGTDIPLHEQLVAAMPQKAMRLVRSLRPQGAIDFRFRADWNDPSQNRAEITQEIRLKNCAILYDRFPYPLRQVNGLVTERENIWAIHDVEGRGWNDATVVVCRGESSVHQDQFRTNLHVQATNVSLDDNLKFALSPGAQQVWGEFRPQGRVDFTVHAICEPGQSDPRIEVVLQPRERSVSIEPATFPYRLEQMEGVAEYNSDGVEFRNVIARHDRAVYSAAAGSWQTAPGGWQLRLTGVNADRLTPHPDLLAALPPHWQRLIEQLQLDGTFGVYNSSLSFAKSPGSDRLAAAWDVNLDCHQAKVRGNFPVQSLTGGIHLIGRHDGQLTQTSGELALDSLVWKDVQLTNVRGPIWVDSTNCFLGEAAAGKQAQSPRRITADAYGGSVAANIEVQQNPGNYKLDLALGGASLARFANERLGGPSDMTGTVSGRLVLSGAGPSTQSLRGQGELNVVDANIYELPVLVAMLKVLKVRAPDTTAFNRCDMQFAIHGADIHFEKLNLLGDAVSLYGKGDSNFDRRLDLVFYTLPEPANLPIPFWKTIAGRVSQQALQLKVVGTWDNAEVQPQTLPGFNQVLEQIQASAATMAPSTATRDGVSLPR